MGMSECGVEPASWLELQKENDLIEMASSTTDLYVFYTHFILNKIDVWRSLYILYGLLMILFPARVSDNTLHPHPPPQAYQHLSVVLFCPRW